MADKPFRVMKGDDADIPNLRYPKVAQVKFDGIRCYVKDGVGYSTSNKPIRNMFIQKWINENKILLEGVDGELIVGEPNHPEVYNKTNSGVMSSGGEPDFAFYVFDRIPQFWHEPMAYLDRYNELKDVVWALSRGPRLKVVNCEFVTCEEELTAFEKSALEAGYEGVMVRDPAGPYKQGRSTAKDQWLNKVKRFKDGEAKIVGFKEAMENTNEATMSETGHTKRSTHASGKVPKGMLGAFECEGVTVFQGLRFDVSGFTHDEALTYWNNREALVGDIIKFKYFPVGVKDLPRFPIFLGFRDEDDISA